MGVEIGMALPQLAQDSRQGKEAGITVTPHRQVLDPPGRGVLKPRFGPGGQVEQLPGVLEEEPPLLGQADRPGGPGKQGDPQLLLQRVDLLGHGGLGHMELLGGPGEIEVLRHGQKAADLKSIHKIFSV